MPRRSDLMHRFVATIPDTLEAGVLYVSIEYAIAVHSCACGCGQDVVTPLSPRDWSLTFDGETVSLSPSIGNWGFACRSHYWIRRGAVVWVPQWDDVVPWWRRWPWRRLRQCLLQLRQLQDDLFTLIVSGPNRLGSAARGTRVRKSLWLGNPHGHAVTGRDPEIHTLLSISGVLSHDFWKLSIGSNRAI